MNGDSYRATVHSFFISINFVLHIGGNATFLFGSFAFFE